RGLAPGFGCRRLSGEASYAHQWRRGSLKLWRGAIRRGVLRTSLAPAGVLLRDTGLRFRVRRNRAKGQESDSGATNVAAPVDKRRRRKGKNWGHSSPRSASIVSLFLRHVKALFKKAAPAWEAWVRLDFLLLRPN